MYQSGIFNVIEPLNCIEKLYLRVSKYLVAKCKPQIWLSRFWSIGIRIFLAGTIAIPIKPLEDLHHLFCCQWMALFIDTLFTTCYHLNHRTFSKKIVKNMSTFLSANNSICILLVFIKKFNLVHKIHKSEKMDNIYGSYCIKQAIVFLQHIGMLFTCFIIQLVLFGYISVLSFAKLAIWEFLTKFQAPNNPLCQISFNREWNQTSI